MCLVRSSNCRQALVAFALVLAAALSAIKIHAQPAAAQLTATYRHGELSLNVAYPPMRAGAGTLTAELLAPEGESLGLAKRRVEVDSSKGAWQLTIVPDKAIAYEEIPWQRVHYRFVYDGEENPAFDDIQSIAQILRRPVVRVLGDNQYIAGSRAAIRIVVADDKNGAPEAGSVRVDLEGAGEKPHLLFAGKLDRRGTVEAAFDFPAGLIGKFAMHFVAETPIGSAEFTQSVELKDKAAILLTTEKPIYQPGQTIHARALALDRATNRADAGRTLTFEVEDSRGNKVFRKATETDQFGIASAEFSLADEVNLGAYHLRALMGDTQAPANTAEITLNVERYVLPKFKVAIEFAENGSEAKHGYRPGDHVTGTVRANYFFGKAVDHAEVTVKASGMDVEVFQAAATTGTTDSDGVYHFDLKLPDYFAGRPLSQGAARVLVEATVKDSAAHSETRGEPITVSQSPLLITAIPEGGTLAPDVENEIFILTSYADGAPARTTVTVHPSFVLDRIALGGEKPMKAQQLETDDAGVAVFHLRPQHVYDPDVPSLPIEADDHHGSRAKSTVSLQIRSGADQILLHANQAIFKAGDRIELDVLSTRARGAAYIDVVKNGQTILTRDIDLENGQGRLTLDATPEMAGTLDVDAYLFGRDAQPVADHRLIFVQPADELKIETTTDAAVYKPGGEARIQFHVTNARGEGVQAALGLQVVDEAVFALAEKQPGFAKVFFYLEQEVMKPRYEIHSLSMTDAVEEEGTAQTGNNQLAARALFSATEMAHPAKVDVEFGRELPQEKFAEFEQRYRAQFLDQLGQIAAELSTRMGKRESDDKIESAFDALEPGGPRDAWNTPLHIQRISWLRGANRYFQVSSAGPDKKFSTADDLSAFIEVQSGTVANQPGQGGTLGLRIEHDRGPMNQLAEATGTVIDPSGAVIGNAEVVLHSLSAGDRRTTHTNAAGQFDLAGLPAGRYEIRISAPGFESLTTSFALAPRDRAILSVPLNVGAVAQTVTVAVGGPVLMTEESAMNGIAGGMGQGFGAAPKPTAAPTDIERYRAQKSLRMELNGGYRATVDESAANAPHVRSYFPEALYINPEILTDGKGNASITIPVADSITTWRMAMLASTQSGALGSGESSLKVFQDFFADLDLPVTLTQGDRISIPVAVYNYSGKTGDVNLKLQRDDWFDLDNDAAEKSVTVDSGRVGGSAFTLIAKRIGEFKLTLTAHMAAGPNGETRDDVLVREIEVVPNGREQDLVVNGTLDGAAKHELNFPVAAIPDATSILVRLYPGPLSQVIEGMDSILQMPYGCFEQTSSSTYPNVLALDYMKRTKKLTPEIHAKAEGFIANGYQRLLTFEVPGGGFSWFGQAPANKILTAYGLMEFSDMAKVSDVDPRLIERTRNWLAGQQKADGSWKPDTSFINEGATNRYNSDVLRITAYIAWALVNSGYRGPAIDKAREYVASHSEKDSDAYTLAVIANFAADDGRDRDFTRRAMESLLDAHKEQGEQIYWTAQETGMYGTGESAAVETTGLATQALLKWGQAPAVTRRALAYLTSKKQAAGNWGTTQATIMALRALLLATQSNASDVHGSLSILLDGKPTQTLELNADNNDLLHQFVFKGIDPAQPAEVELKLDGAGSLAYQIVSRAFVPWAGEPKSEPLAIDIAWDRTKLAQNDLAKATATIHNNLPQTANMVMVDLGIPPGFELLTEDLQDFQEKSANAASGRFEKFSLTATQAILYFDALAPGQTITLSYRLRAKYPVRARTFASRVYEYYDPDINATAQPTQLEVAGNN
jgi:uncharacterized protein YfaS (alpha-2-macroglobulin family)